jgi:anti-sigma factor RsiW
MIRRLFRRRRDYPCAQFVEEVTDYVEGALTREEAARLERHLRKCGGCTRYLAQIRATIRLTGRLTVEDVEQMDQAAREELMDAFRELHAGNR